MPSTSWTTSMGRPPRWRALPQRVAGALGSTQAALCGLAIATAALGSLAVGFAALVAVGAGLAAIAVLESTGWRPVRTPRPPSPAPAPDIYSRREPALEPVTE